MKFLHHKNKSLFHMLYHVIIWSPMAQSAANWCNTFTRMDHTHSLTHRDLQLHQHIYNHVVQMWIAETHHFSVPYQYTWRVCQALWAGWDIALQHWMSTGSPCCADKHFPQWLPPQPAIHSNIHTVKCNLQMRITWHHKWMNECTGLDHNFDKVGNNSDYFTKVQTCNNCHTCTWFSQ